MLTRPAQFLGGEDRTYVLVAVPSEGVIDAISVVQSKLVESFPNAIWAMPHAALHITLLELMQRGEFSVDKDDFYLQNKSRIHTSIMKILSLAKPIRLHFDSIVVSQDAVTVQSSDVAECNKLRSGLVAQLILPPDTKAPPPIVHSSIARYKSPVPAAHIERVVANINIDVSMTVQYFELRRTIVQPMQKFDVLETFSLDRLL